MGVWYATREDAASALDTGTPWRMNRQVDNALENASRKVEGLLHRRFYPELSTRYFDWPDLTRGPSWLLWLDANELVSLTSATAAGDALDVNDLLLEPQRYGPPYNRVETDRASNTVFTSADTSQRALGLTGVYGYQLEETPVTTVAEALDATETLVDTASSAQVGVGSLIRVDSERMVVIGKQLITTAQTLQANIDAKASTVTVPVVAGTGFEQGEWIVIDAEAMQIIDIAGNNLIVKRSQSNLAAHTATATIYAPRTLQVTRGALGTTAATHLTSAPVQLFSYPGPVRELAVGYALQEIQQRGSGYARTVGPSGHIREISGRGIENLEKQALASCARRGRLRSA